MNKLEVTKLHTFSGHADSVYTIESVSSSQLVSGAGDGMVVLWDLRNPYQGQLIANLEHSIYTIHAVPQLPYIVVGHNYDGIHIIDWENKKEIGSLKMTTEAIFAIASDKNQVFIGTADGVLTVIDIDCVRVIDKVKLSNDRIRSIATCPLHNELAVGSSDSIIRILDLDGLQVKHELKSHTKTVMKVLYSSDFEILISAGRDAHLSVWSVSDQYSLAQDIVAHTYAINDVAYRKDASLFATCSMDKTIKIWDASSYRLLKVIDKVRHGGHSSSVNRLSWDNDSDALVSASDDRSIKIWGIDRTKLKTKT